MQRTALNLDSRYGDAVPCAGSGLGNVPRCQECRRLVCAGVVGVDADLDLRCAATLSQEDLQRG